MRFSSDSRYVPLGIGFAVVLVVVVFMVAMSPRRHRPAGNQEQSPTTPARKVRRRIPPPLFSPEYSAALKDVLELEANDIAKLERRLLAEPDDWMARLKVMAYYMRADQAGREESRDRRTQHALWLIEHHPESEILSSPYALFDSGALTGEEYQRAKQLWELAAEAKAPNARVLWNAACFFGPIDPKLHTGYARGAFALEPQNEHYARAVGTIYAAAILQSAGAFADTHAAADPAFVQYARQQLDTTNHAMLLEAAVQRFQLEYNRSLMLGRELREVGALAQHYFQRAEALDPEMDRAWIMPQIEPKMIGMLAPGAPPPPVDTQRYEAAARKIRRLPIDAFPQLPAMVTRALRDRRCLVPQPTADGRPANVIRGQFFRKGQTGWAVVCSVDGWSGILVFRNDLDAKPEEIGRTEDKAYAYELRDGRAVYQREIRPVGRDFIVQHYRAYGGPEPPPIDHQGIDDAFLEKASIVNYWYRGKWLQLTGAD